MSGCYFDTTLFNIHKTSQIQGHGYTIIQGEGHLSHKNAFQYDAYRPLQLWSAGGREMSAGEGGCLPGGYLPRGSVCWGCLPGGCLPGSVCPGGVCQMPPL